MEKKRFLICNMDERQQYLAEILQRTGDEVVEENEFDESEPFFGMLLPVTQTDEYFRRLQGHMKKGMYIFGSNFSEDAKMWAKTMQFTLVDYMKEPGRRCEVGLQTLAAYQLAEFILHIVGTVCPEVVHHLSYVACQTERGVAIVGQDAIRRYIELGRTSCLALTDHWHKWQGIKNIAKLRNSLFALGVSRVPSAESHTNQFHHECCRMIGQ